MTSFPRVSIQTVFLLLIISQALHSIEEYYFSLWEVFEPARIVSGLVSTNLTVGSVIVNVSIVVFGVWCYFGPLRHAWRSATIIAWFWVLLELGNSIGHSYFDIARAAYFPGLYTALLLFIFSCYLAYSLVKDKHEATAI